MQLLQDIWFFIKSLTLVDYVFFFAIIMLLVLIITLIYFIKLNKETFAVENTVSNNNDDLLEITKELEKIEEKPRIEFTDYEKDQEEKAIISYDELLKKGKVSNINYDDEKDLDGLSIKRISLDNIVDDKKEEKEIKPEFNCRIISYKQEEDFLIALKQLNNLLN